MVNVYKLWYEVKLTDKIKFQEMIFPEGVLYDYSAFGTTKTADIYTLKQLIDTPNSTMVPGGRIELPWITPHDFESCASTNSAIPAYSYQSTRISLKIKYKKCRLELVERRCGELSGRFTGQSPSQCRTGAGSTKVKNIERAIDPMSIDQATQGFRRGAMERITKCSIFMVMPFTFKTEPLALDQSSFSK